MNSKTKFSLSVMALIFVALTLVLAIATASVFGVMRINNFNFSFDASKVNGFVKANYCFAGQKSPMTTDGTNNGSTILNYNGETKSSVKQLKILNDDTIVLTSANNYVVFEYSFSNTNEEESFSLYAEYQDTQKEDKNITVKWGYSFVQIEDFNEIEEEEDDEEQTGIFVFDFFNDPISNLEIAPGTTYLYIKAYITNSGQNAEFSGDFIFQMIG